MALLDRTHYDVLGISRDADASAVRSAWKLHVQAWHPDRFGQDLKVEAERQTALINEAYSVLRDSSRRAAYDCRLAADELAAKPERAPRRSSRAPMQVHRASTAPVGSPMVAVEPAAPSTLGEQLAAIGDDALRVVQRHPRLFTAVGAACLLMMVGSVVIGAMTGSTVPVPMHTQVTAAVAATDRSQTADLEAIAKQAQAESAAADAALQRMQAEDARMAAQDAAAARAADARMRRQLAKRRGGAQPGGRVIRVMPSNVR